MQVSTRRRRSLAQGVGSPGWSGLRVSELCRARCASGLFVDVAPAGLARLDGRPPSRPNSRRDTPVRSSRLHPLRSRRRRARGSRPRLLRATRTPGGLAPPFSSTRSHRRGRGRGVRAAALCHRALRCRRSDAAPPVDLGDLARHRRRSGRRRRAVAVNQPDQSNDACTGQRFRPGGHALREYDRYRHESQTSIDG